MEEALRLAVQRGEAGPGVKLDCAVDARGNFIYKLHGIHSVIRDTGNSIFFTQNNNICLNIAKIYGELRWGKIELQNNMASPARYNERKVESFLGI
jgi:hypothetical protein